VVPSRVHTRYHHAVVAVLNDTFYPVLLSRIEEPLAPKELESYFQKLAGLADRAILKRERYVVIVMDDISKFSAAGRKQIAEVQARYVTPQRNDATLAAYASIDNAFVRGAVTAIRWFAPDLVRHLHVSASREDALDEALSALERRGTPFAGDFRALRAAMGLPS
jgi:hypothetical protein